MNYCEECGIEISEDEYWCPRCIEADDEIDYEEREENERLEIAANCTCGAWQICENGDVIHTADCCCGAE
jgi:hypothetical protein